MPPERKSDGTGPSRLRNVWYLVVTEGTPGDPITRTAEA